MDAPTFTGNVSLPSSTNIGTVTNLEIGYLGGVTSGIQDQINDKAPINNAVFTGTFEAPVATITGAMIANGTIQSANIENGAIDTIDIADNAVTGDKIADATIVEGNLADGSVTSSKIAAGAIVDGDINASAGIATSKIAGLDTALGLLAPLDSPTFTGTVTLPANTISQSMMGDDSVGTNEIGGLAVTTEKIADGAVTTAKIATGAVTKAMVGLENADNTSDANKPISTATQTALDLKAPKAAPTFTGTLTAADVTISGNLTVSGTTTTVNTTNFTTADPVIYLGEGNNANLVDIGFVGSYNDGTYAHQGLVKDSSDGKWKLFKGVTDEPTTTVNFTQGSLDDLAVADFTASSATIGNISNTELQYLNNVSSNIQTQLDAKLASSTASSTYETITNVNLKAPKADPTFTGTVTVSASGIAFTDGTQTKAGVPSITTIPTAITAGAHSLATGRADQLVPLTGAVVITLPSTGYSTGQSIDFYQESGTGARFESTNSVVGTPGLKFRTTHSVVTAMKTAAGWLVFGDLSL